MLLFPLGDTCTFRTYTGSGGGLIRMAAIFNIVVVIGQTGLTPTLTIGTVTSLLSGNVSTATIIGTTNNPVINLGLVKGSDGINGIGITPNISIGNVIALPYGTYPYANITGTTLNPLLNLGLEQGSQGL